MIKGLVPPLVAAGILGALSVAGAALGTYDVNLVFHCTYSIARDDKPAADVLLVGNSQTGAGIDPVYLEALLSEQAGEPVEVEKMAIVRSNIAAMRMLLQDYVEHRGAPRMVVMQPLVTRSAVLDSPAGHPVHPRENLAFQDWDELTALRNDARHGTTGSWLPYWAQKGYRTVAALWVDRQVERITAALSVTRNAPWKKFCETDDKYRLTGNWPYGTVPLKPGDDIGPTLDEAGRAQWQKEMAQRKPVSLDDPARGFEFDQNRKTITELEAAGSQVLLIGYPSLGREDIEGTEFAGFAKSLDTEMLDVRRIVTDDEREKLNTLYRDPVHVNFAGTEIVTRRVAQAIGSRLK